MVARKLGNICRFADYLIAINDGNKFEKHYNEIVPPNSFLKRKTLYTETTFLDLHLCINEGQIQTPLYDKKNSYNINLRFPYKSSTIQSKMFFETISEEILRICRATSSVLQIMKTSKVFLHRMMRKGTDPLGVKRYFFAIINFCGKNYCETYFCNFGNFGKP